jgi:hypothetical protein
MRQRYTDDDRHAEQRLDHAAQDVSDQHRDAGDGHSAKPGDDALGHVHGDRYRRPLGGGGDGDQHDSGSDVVDVFAAAAGEAAEPGAERGAEHVDEQQQEDDRQADEQQGHGRVAQHVS